MDDVAALVAAGGHEQVVLVDDRPTGLRAIVAVHSTALGPALGGIRFWRYESERDALIDALRLSEAMTLKASLAGLHQGGGKAVVLVDDPTTPRSEELLHALGRAIDELGGRYLAAEDVGATPRDMDVIATETPWVTGVGEASRGSGDPSPVTAFGVLHGMRVVAGELDGEASLRGRRVVVQGVGHVGAHLVRLLVVDGADVTIADPLPDRVDALVRELGVAAVPTAAVLDERCDVLAPCALGAVLDGHSVLRLRCRAVCGAANNQLADSSVDRALADRGIVYAPDFVVNAGGILNIAEEFVGYSRVRALAAAARIGETTATVFELARRWQLPPGAAAVRLARERIAREGRGRWKPGDPAAWTGGAPMRSLRPV